MPSPHSLYGLEIILVVSVYVYMDMNCFGLVCVVSSWLWVGSVCWRIVLGGWFRLVFGVCGWFRVVSGGLPFQ